MSQLAPLPSNLPFRFVSKTIGRGAYASIKKAVPLDALTPVFAVKLIHKEYAVKRGHISMKQIKMEVSLHSYIGQHPNIIEWFASGEDATWQWIAMEFASGGDLFDKIEADVGVPEDIAQLYFLQLVAGVSFVHSKGVAHRDLKPENILLSESGNLKIADFGMATMFAHKGQRKMSSTLCGSPPYIAPEILSCRTPDPRVGKARPYDPEAADIWSCGVILFVLLVGNTPWDEPSPESWEFQEYKKTDGHSSDSLWEGLAPDALSLLRGMLRVDPDRRFSFPRIRQHPWYTRPNRLLTSDGKIQDPIHLATQMLERLRIDMSQRPTEVHSQQETPSTAISMDTSSGPMLSASQPEAPLDDVSWDWERPALRSMGASAISSTQPMSRQELDFTAEMPRRTVATSGGRAAALPPPSTLSALAEEPTMSQFSQTPGASLSLTQAARRFRDIVPAESLTRFFSAVPPTLLIQMLSDALHQLNVPLPPVHRADPEDERTERVATLRVRATDGRRQALHGEIQVDRQRWEDDSELLDVRFVKIKGDPLEWRRFFKKTVLLCKEGVYVPE